MTTKLKVGDIVRITHENKAHFWYNSLQVDTDLIIYALNDGICKLRFLNGTKFADGEGFYTHRFELVTKKNKEDSVLEKIKYLNDKYKTRQAARVGLGNNNLPEREPILTAQQRLFARHHWANGNLS